jgi:3',5'-cyclic AMP phosphodiesterase CpdA
MGRILPAPDSFRFAVTGNTYPDSPYKWSDDVLVRTIQSINRENPLFLVHTGDMIHGGNDWMGIRETDLNRQFDRFLAVMGRLDSILYTIPGEMDLYNNTHTVYEQRTGRKAFYSFNYGTTHFIVMETRGKGDSPVNADVLDWLKGDLKVNRRTAAIIVLTHDFLVKKARQGGEHAPLCPELHGLFRTYPVKAVISGDNERYFECKIDNISYVNAGCGGFRVAEKYQQNSQYYVMDFNGQELRVKGRNVPK